MFLFGGGVVSHGGSTIFGCCEIMWVLVGVVVFSGRMNDGR